MTTANVGDTLQNRFATREEAITKTLRIISALLLCISSLYIAASTPGTLALGKMKSLVGSWEGKTADGRPVTASYELTAGGTSLLTARPNVGGMKTYFAKLCAVQDFWTQHCALNFCPIPVGNTGVNNSQCVRIDDKIHRPLVLIESAILDGRSDCALVPES